MRNKLLNILNIKYPIIQGGMIWCSGSDLAAAVSNCGGLGVLGAGSMYPIQLEEEIDIVKSKTKSSFAVNLPLLYPNINDHISIIIEKKVPIVITSAGNPNIWTKTLQENGIKVIHVVSNSYFALKAQNCGVDAIVAEGFEAGGHNGREETTTMCLIPQLSKIINIPLIAAGGISCGRSMLAAFSLGANAVQMGTRFLMSKESNAHINFKNKILNAKEGDTKLLLKKITPVRMLENNFMQKVLEAENIGASKEELEIILGKAKAKLGMNLGDIENGELEVGQVSSLIREILSVEDIFKNILSQYNEELKLLNTINIL